MSTTPIEADLPHTLGREAAKARMAAGLDKLADFVPGGAITEQRWDGDTLVLTVEGLGQRVGARLTAFDAHVHAVFDLPPLLAMVAGRLREKLKKDGTKLLE